MGTKSKEGLPRRTKGLQWSFLTLFAGVAIALSIPGMIADDDGFLTRESNKQPQVVKVGWRRGYVQGLQVTNLEELFSTDARNTGLALFSLLVFSCACALLVWVLGSLGFCFDIWFARLAFTTSCLGALAGITLLFIAPKFANEVDARLKIRTRERLDVICDATVVCEDVFSLEECMDQHTQAELRGTRLLCEQDSSPGAPLMCKVDEEGSEMFADCDTTRFIKDCSLPGVVCKVSRGSTYQITLGLGLHWLLFGMITIAIFIPKINLKPEQHPSTKPPEEY